MKEPILCSNCGKTIDSTNIQNRFVPPYIIDIPAQKDKIFCSATCGNSYCKDKDIPFRFCCNPNCAKRGSYFKKSKMFPPPHAIFCQECFLQTFVKCVWCGREYTVYRNKAQKTNDPERFCGRNCEKRFHEKTAIQKVGTVQQYQRNSLKVETI